MKKNKTDAKKIGPLKLAALNGLTLARMPLPDEGKEESTRATNDERVWWIFLMFDFSFTQVVFENQLHMNGALCQLQSASNSEQLKHWEHKQNEE